MRHRTDPRWKERREESALDVLDRTIARMPADQQERIRRHAQRQERFAEATKRGLEDPAGERKKVAEYMQREDPETMEFMRGLASVFGRLHFVGHEVAEYEHKGTIIVHRGRVAL